MIEKQNLEKPMARCFPDGSLLDSTVEVHVIPSLLTTSLSI